MNARQRYQQKRLSVVSDTMAATINEIRARGGEEGELVWRRGGFWTYEGCHGKIVGDRFVPDWYVIGSTIDALLRRNLIVVTERGGPTLRAMRVKLLRANAA